MFVATDIKWYRYKFIFMIEPDKQFCFSSRKKAWYFTQDYLRCWIPGSFDLLFYTDKNLEIPDKLQESSACLIPNAEQVKLRSFSTSVHRVDGAVSYKFSMWLQVQIEIVWNCGALSARCTALTHLRATCQRTVEKDRTRNIIQPIWDEWKAFWEWDALSDAVFAL